MTPLALSGPAVEIEGGETQGQRLLFRLGDPSSPEMLGERDAALIRNSTDCAFALRAGFRSAVILAPESFSDATFGFKTTVRLPARFSYLSAGDVIGLDRQSRRLRVLYRRTSKHNAFLVTERCNHYCLMCSQPPRDIDDGWILDEIFGAIELVDPATEWVGFTGGEPLLEWQRFIAVLTVMRDRLPNTAIHVLTNGRGFAVPQISTAWAAVGHKWLSAGIPVYSAVDTVHDYAVQAPGAFDETVLGILRLKDRGQRVEVRVVLHGITAPRLRETCGWLARNLPFIDHVALMGMENTGFALANQEVLWIDPIDYKADLAAGVDLLRAAGVKVSVYNLPLCLLDRSLWNIAVQSISDWKNGYLPECAGCAQRSSCAGFFSTGRMRRSRGIAPIVSS